MILRNSTNCTHCSLRLKDGKMRRCGLTPPITGSEKISYRYVQKNSSSFGQAWNSELPEFLNERPKRFVEKIIPALKNSHSIKGPSIIFEDQAEGQYKVGEYGVTLTKNEMMCQCYSFRRQFNSPCKHLLALMQVESISLPSKYLLHQWCVLDRDVAPTSTAADKLLLDVCDETQCSEAENLQLSPAPSSPVSSGKSLSTNHAALLRETLKEVNSLTFLLYEDCQPFLDKVSNLYSKMRAACPQEKLLLRPKSSTQRVRRLKRRSQMSSSWVQKRRRTCFFKTTGRVGRKADRLRESSQQVNRLIRNEQQSTSTKATIETATLKSTTTETTTIINEVVPSNYSHILRSDYWLDSDDMDNITAIVKTQWPSIQFSSVLPIQRATGFNKADGPYAQIIHMSNHWLAIANLKRNLCVCIFDSLGLPLNFDVLEAIASLEMAVARKSAIKMKRCSFKVEVLIVVCLHFVLWLKFLVAEILLSDTLADTYGDI